MYFPPVTKWEIYWRSFKILLRIFSAWVRKQAVPFFLRQCQSLHLKKPHASFGNPWMENEAGAFRCGPVDTVSRIYWKWFMLTADLFLCKRSIAFVIQGKQWNLTHTENLVNSRFFILKSVCQILSGWIHYCDDTFASLYVSMSVIFLRTVS